VVKKTTLFLVLLALGCAVVAGDSSGAASSYPTPLRLQSTASSVTGSWTMGTTIGTADTTTQTVSTNNATDDGWYTFAPGTPNSTRLDSISTGPAGTGWIVDPVGGVSGFPAGNWLFTVQTFVPGASLDAGSAVLTVGMWKGTISGGVFTPTATLLDPTDDPAGQDLRSDFLVSTTATYALPMVVPLV